MDILSAIGFILALVAVLVAQVAAVAIGIVFVAATYNNKIKRIGTDSGVVSTLAGSGERALRDGGLLDAAFYEPGGLSVVESRVYVADTNNHAVRVVDLEAGEVRTLNVDF